MLLIKFQFYFVVEPSSTSVLHKKGEVDINVLVQSVSGDMLKSEKCGQWPISCYGPFQAKPCFPGFEDKCFEEVRIGYYEAQKSGTLEQYKQQLGQILQEAMMKIKALQVPNPEAVNVIREIYNSNSTQKNVFGNQKTFANSPPQQNPIFGNQSTTHTQNIFNAGTAQNQQNGNFSFKLPENKSAFGNQAQFQGGNSIFGSAPPQQNMFNQQSTGNIFGSSTNQPVQTSNIFQSTANQQVPLSTAPNSHQQSIFGAPPVVSNAPNVFSNAGSIFGSAPTPFQAQPQNKSVFGTQPQSNPVFAQNQTQNVFASPFNQQTIQPTFPGATVQNTVLKPEQSTQSQHSANIFGNKTTVTANVTVKRTDDPTVYSRASDLTKEELAAYQNDRFEFGKIPTKAPSLELC